MLDLDSSLYWAPLGSDSFPYPNKFGYKMPDCNIQTLQVNKIRNGYPKCCSSFCKFCKLQTILNLRSRLG